MKLSILIATLEQRKSQFQNLIKHIEKQKTDEVEIVFLSDSKQMSIGNKRQKLLEMSKGEYVCFIDDDDWIPDTYIENIMKGIKKGVDCVGFLVMLTGWGNGKILCSLSNRWSGWYDNMGGFRYVRCPNHLSVIRRDIALIVGYKNMRGAEDSDFSLRLKALGLCQTEHFIDEVMYEYRYKHEHNKYG